MAREVPLTRVGGTTSQMALGSDAQGPRHPVLVDRDPRAAVVCRRLPDQRHRRAVQAAEAQVARLRGHRVHRVHGRDVVEVGLRALQGVHPGADEGVPHRRHAVVVGGLRRQAVVHVGGAVVDDGQDAPGVGAAVGVVDAVVHVVAGGRAPLQVDAALALRRRGDQVVGGAQFPDARPGALGPRPRDAKLVDRPHPVRLVDVSLQVHVHAFREVILHDDRRCAPGGNG